ncbi:hypothetical protein LSTR_LSTR003290 [Laodelphax striatellus]|uniref:Winged helix-turn-helix domain-containing protein n=1 Tax=Laodelphax striatellus TaxID=195883 RepID=A0A482XU52_LAOST|nr:hypothetical protein LSTR_LSTR003290 [Laodelphax striatellus]
MVDTTKEQIVMTPKGRTANQTNLIIERKAVKIENNSDSEKIHVAGGDHQGIVINKFVASEVDDQPAELSLEFRVFLVNAQNGKHIQESRTLLFWFSNSLPSFQHASVAQDFFKELVSPQEFPRDYVGFIKKLMKLMQLKYSSIKKVEVIIRKLDEPEKLPSRPLSADESIFANGKQIPITEERVLELIESSYPNPVTIKDMVKEHSWSDEDIVIHIKELQKKKLVKAMEHGAFTRVVSHDPDIQIVKQMPTMIKAKQPTIAIITAQYCEKLAVDAMIENKETFVRYTTVGVKEYSKDGATIKRQTRFGESNVYTLGNMGAHRIVCTKLPSVGHTREAMTAAGNTTTRLLGTFQKVDYVILVGLGGGVPHYTDFNKHVRLGDVVVAHSTNNNRAVYTYCENANERPDGQFAFDHKDYQPSNFCLQHIASQLKAQSEAEGDAAPWLKFLAEAENMLSSAESESDFRRPAKETDKLYMSIGEEGVIEVAHPTSTDPDLQKRLEGRSRIHTGVIASGRAVCRNEQLRQKFSEQHVALAWDSEFDSVIESAQGNCKDCFAVVRGISDYKDGTRKSPWQPYASLAAAAVVKAIVCAMDPPTDA